MAPGMFPISRNYASTTLVVVVMVVMMMRGVVKPWTVEVVWIAVERAIEGRIESAAAVKPVRKSMAIKPVAAAKMSAVSGPCVGRLGRKTEHHGKRQSRNT